MKDYSKQIENLRSEITEAIIGLLGRHGLTELAFPDTQMEPKAPDSVYVIFFDNDGEPFECAVTRISVTGKSLRITALEKYSGNLLQTESEFDLPSRSPIWLNEILLTVQELLEQGNEPLKT